MWKLIRAGTEPGADRRRTMRWERLGEVLRELDELRERGEQLVRRARPDGRLTRRPAPIGPSRTESAQSASSRAVAIPWGRSAKRPLERGDRPSP